MAYVICFVVIVLAVKMLFAKQLVLVFANLALLLHFRQSEYDPKLLELFRSKVLRMDEALTSQRHKTSTREKQIFVDKLGSGMVLTRDINDRHGTLIVAKGTIITDVLKFKLNNYFRSQAIITPIYIEDAQ